MALYLLLLVVASVQSQVLPTGTTVEYCDGSLRIGDVIVSNDTPNLKDGHVSAGVEVEGCGAWIVYSRRRNSGSQFCIDSSHGLLTEAQLRFSRVRSVRKLHSCPRVANINFTLIICVVGLVIFTLIVTVLVVRKYRKKCHVTGKTDSV